MGEYARYERNTPLPRSLSAPARYKPNDFGLFDAAGNVAERVAPLALPDRPPGDRLLVEKTTECRQYGSTIGGASHELTLSTFTSADPDQGYNLVGLRLARSLSAAK